AAWADFSKAIKLDPKLAVAYAGRGTTYWQQGKVQPALADWNEAIRLNPKYTIPYLNSLHEPWRTLLRVAARVRQRARRSRRGDQPRPEERPGLQQPRVGLQSAAPI